MRHLVDCHSAVRSEGTKETKSSQSKAVLAPIHLHCVRADFDVTVFPQSTSGTPFELEDLGLDKHREF